MCGIIAYIGDKQATPILVEGLRRLEYRGYDSAGIAVYEDGNIQTIKVAGKIKELARTVDRTTIAGSVGIAHTRWATHGAPTEKNAHPHLDTDETVAVVHNGIIENFYTLRDRLKAEGFVFRSDSDTEVLSHLIRHYFHGNLEDAVQKALLEVEGTYGIAVISSLDPGKIVGARNGSPLVVGVGKGE
ncbi:MAG: glutamine--fructose-6-phosphate aminotransferase, partial [Gemmatimonadetes bacterium]|nr:glutamine--fructose-6-phosphate aminotransferase [Gemmatimonadota bacterium]